MTDQQEMHRRGRALLGKPGTFGVVLGVLSIASALVFGILTLTPDHRELTIECLYGEELTIQPEVAGLTGTFQYMDEIVAHLWRIRLRVINTGNRSIVGVGPSCNILYGKLTLQLPDGARFMSVEASENHPGAQLELREDYLDISFEQWPSGEELVLSCLAASDISMQATPFPVPLSRQIIEGKIRVVTRGGVGQRRLSRLDTFPGSLKAFVRFMGIVALVAIIAVLGGVGIAYLYTYIRWKLSLRRFAAGFKRVDAFLESINGMTLKKRERVMRTGRQRPFLVGWSLKNEVDGITLSNGQEHELEELTDSIWPFSTPMSASLTISLVAMLACLGGVAVLGLALIDFVPLV